MRLLSRCPGQRSTDSVQPGDTVRLTAKHKVATPAQWQQGDDVIIAGLVSNDQAKEIWPEGWKEPKPCIRIVAQPT